MVGLEYFRNVAEISEYRSIFILSHVPRSGLGVNEHNIGFLVKKDLPFDIEVQSFRNVRRKNYEERLFTRDLPVIVLK